MSNPPKVFISYSHDSEEHKKWVNEFSNKLANEGGIEVILDAWSLELGDDISKFMENSVKSADKVLMICTENYVVKANEGKGGAGYEAMIVTGQLVNDLGTNKFIPVVRQDKTTPILPTSVSTRYYVNMSANSKTEFEKLKRAIHKIPATAKPIIGKNPFTREQSLEKLSYKSAESQIIAKSNTKTQIKNQPKSKKLKEPLIDVIKLLGDSFTNGNKELSEIDIRHNLSSHPSSVTSVLSNLLSEGYIKFSKNSNNVTVYSLLQKGLVKYNELIEFK